ncbi:hypothetical protein MG293_000883 [Ovis ammon polii]|uniref:Uncharacterized protein n=1 Tax=Ovis ammon polii TaxID=230172 RepID=A0AAD4UJU9_OVIAM|nr:hypothetical protein MG293_000883 [Ovis ammon polii]
MTCSIMPFEDEASSVMMKKNQGVPLLTIGSSSRLQRGEYFEKEIHSDRIMIFSKSFFTRRRQWHPTPALLPGKSHGSGAWKAAFHGVAKSRTRLSDFTFAFHFHALEKEMATHSSVLAWRIPETGAWWAAAVYGVAQYRTRLKSLSSSSFLH